MMPRVRLRILAVAPLTLFTDHVPYGDGLVAHAFVSELAARGHEVHVAAQSADLRGEPHRDVHLHRLPGGALPRPLARLAAMAAVRRLHRRLERERPFDLVHQLNPVEPGVSLAFAGRSARIVLGPLVPDWDPSAQVPGARVNPAALRAKRVLRAAQQRRATMALLSTPAAESLLSERARASLLVRELPYGIDAGAWRPPPDREPGQRVLFLSNLEVRKGVHTLLDAWELLAPQLPDARLAVAGVGTQLDAVRRRVDAAPALHGVELLGRVERADVLAAIQACDVFCIPSHGEPFGIAALEAMACARPIVATDAGGLGHVVPDDGGRKVPPRDARALAAALHELLADADLRRAMGDRNRRAVEERYTWERVVERLETLYGEAISSATVPGR